MLISLRRLVVMALAMLGVGHGRALAGSDRPWLQTANRLRAEIRESVGTAEVKAEADAARGAESAGRRYRSGGLDLRRVLGAVCRAVEVRLGADRRGAGSARASHCREHRRGAAGSGRRQEHAGRVRTQAGRRRRPGAADARRSPQAMPKATKQQIVAEAKTAAQQEHQRAMRDIRTATDAAVEELSQRSADLAVELAGKVISAKLTPEERSKLVQDSLTKFAAATPSQELDLSTRNCNRWALTDMEEPLTIAATVFEAADLRHRRVAGGDRVCAGAARRRRSKPRPRKAWLQEFDSLVDDVLGSSCRSWKRCGNRASSKKMPRKPCCKRRSAIRLRRCFSVF